MLTFMMQKAVGGKKRAVLVLDPDDVDRMKAGKPVSVDFAQDARNKVGLIAVVGFTPDRNALEKELDTNKRWGGKVGAEELLMALTKCQDLPEKRIRQ